jgi:hypothetical protein
MTAETSCSSLPILTNLNSGARCCSPLWKDPLRPDIPCRQYIALPPAYCWIVLFPWRPIQLDQSGHWTTEFHHHRKNDHDSAVGRFSLRASSANSSELIQIFCISCHYVNGSCQLSIPSVGGNDVDSSTYLASLSLAVSIMLVLYFAFWVVFQSYVDSTSFQDTQSDSFSDDQIEDLEESRVLPFPFAAVAFICTAISTFECASFMMDAVDKIWGNQIPHFVGFQLIPMVLGAAEFLIAVVVAVRNKMWLVCAHREPESAEICTN